jgi:CRP/FNR family transcriptional regulator, cyclic AMP receptor protein
MSDDKPFAFDPLELIKRIHTQATTREYRNRQPVFAQGDKADAIFFVQHGHVKLTVESQNGKKAVVGIFRHGDVFGEGCLLKQSLRTCTAMAIQPSTISRVERTTLLRIINKEPAFAKLVIFYLLSRIARIQQEFVDQIFSSSERRLARILLMLAGFGVHSNPEPVFLKISQETLAEMVGTTRSRVSHFMNQFRKLGFVDYNGTLQVHKTLRTFLLHG